MGRYPSADLFVLTASQRRVLWCQIEVSPTFWSSSTSYRPKSSKLNPMNSQPGDSQHPYAPPQSVDAPPESREAKSHFAFASVMLAILSGVAACATVVTAGMAEVRTPGGLESNDTLTIVIGLCVFGVMGANLVGIGLALVSFFRPERRRLLAVVALAFHLVVFLFLLGLLSVGLVLEMQAR